MGVAAGRRRGVFAKWLIALPLAAGIGVPANAPASDGRIRIVGTNDIHGYLRPVHYRYPDQPSPWGSRASEGDYINKAEYEGPIGGIARVATVIRELRDEKSDGALLVDAGDTWHGSGFTFFDRGYTMVKVMNELKYDAMVPGNWEYAYTRDHLLELIDLADFPVLAFNLTDREWGEPVLERYIIKQVGGLKVALIGLTYPWTALSSAAEEAAKWWSFGIKENDAQELIDEIRREEQPDLVILLSHAGHGLDQKFARRVDGIDVIVSGHTHNAVFDPVVWNDTIIYEGGSLGEYVSALDLTVVDGKVRSYAYKLVKVHHDYVTPDPAVAKLVDAGYSPHAKMLGEVIGRANGMFYRQDHWQSTLGNFLTDSLRSMEDADISLFPSWRFGATLMPGDITVEDVYNLVPVGSPILTYTLTGKQLKNLFENFLDSVVNLDAYSRVGGDMIRFSGVHIVYDLDNPGGGRIVSMSLPDGSPFLMDGEYKVAAVNTRFQNNPLFGAGNVKDTGKVFVEELVEYIRDNSPIVASLDERIRPRRETVQ